jgi:hypothetical protein
LALTMLQMSLLFNFQSKPFFQNFKWMFLSTVMIKRSLSVWW